MSECIETIKILVELQQNGILRRSDGTFLGRVDDSIKGNDFESLKTSKPVDPWKPVSGTDYDMLIHMNRDAYAWASFFVDTYPGLAEHKDVMLGWFANAMMAMHDSIRSEETKAKALPEQHSSIEDAYREGFQQRGIDEDCIKRKGPPNADLAWEHSEAKKTAQQTVKYCVLSALHINCPAHDEPVLSNRIVPCRSFEELVAVIRAGFGEQKIVEVTRFDTDLPGIRVSETYVGHGVSEQQIEFLEDYEDKNSKQVSGFFLGPWKQHDAESEFVDAEGNVCDKTMIATHLDSYLKHVSKRCTK